jgi:hypothetical protein
MSNENTWASVNYQLIQLLKINMISVMHTMRKMMKKAANEKLLHPYDTFLPVHTESAIVLYHLPFHRDSFV